MDNYDFVIAEMDVAVEIVGENSRRVQKKIIPVFYSELVFRIYRSGWFKRIFYHFAIISCSSLSLLKHMK